MPRRALFQMPATARTIRNKVPSIAIGMTTTPSIMPKIENESTACNETMDRVSFRMSQSTPTTETIDVSLARGNLVRNFSHVFAFMDKFKAAFT